MSRKKGSSHLRDTGFLKKNLASRLHLAGKNSLSTPLKELDEAKLWMSGPVIVGTAQMPCSNATTKAALGCQSTSSIIRKKTSKYDSTWIWIWKQSRNCNRLRTRKSRLRKITLCRGLFSAIAVTRCWMPRKPRTLPRLQQTRQGWAFELQLNKQGHGQRWSLISPAQTPS